MMKKLVACFLAITLLLSVGYVSYAETSQTEEVTFKYDILKSLGILPETTEHENYGLVRDLSKKAFLAYVCNIYGDYGYTEDDGDKAVALAESLGLIHANQDDLYKLITYDEAMTILIRMLDYELHAQQAGGFPHGYNRIAASIGLADYLSVASGQTLKEHDVVNLLYNAINAPFAQIDHVSEEGITYSYLSDRTILHEYRGIYRIDGVVEATGFSSLRPDEAVDEGQIRIGGYNYKTDKDYTSYLGLKVVAYADEQPGGLDMLIAATPYGNTEIVIDAEDIQGPDSQFTKLSYYDANDSLKEARFDGLVTVLYNNQPLGTFTREAFMPKDGSVRLIENNQSTGYDVVVITNYETLVVGSVSKLTESVTNTYKYAPIQKLELEEEEDNIVNMTMDGAEISVKDLAEGDVLKVAKSTLNGKTIMDIRASRNRITGTISAMKTEDDVKLTIDGVDFVLSETYEAMLSHNPVDPKALSLKIGNSYLFYLDADGEIAFAQDTEGTIRYGIVYATASEGTFNSVSYAKIFTSEGEWKEYLFADKVSFYDGNGTEGRLKSNEVAGQLPQAKNGTMNVVGYMLNGDNAICQVVLPEINDGEGNNGKFNKLAETQSIYYRTGNISFDSELFIKDNSVMWFVNTDEPEKEESYTLGARSLFNNDELCTLTAYNISAGGFTDYFIINRTASNTAQSVKLGDLFVVDEIQETMNSEGDHVFVIVGKIGIYETFSYYCEDASIANSLDHGDVISLHTNSRGYIDKVSKYVDFDPNNTTIFTDPATQDKGYGKVMHSLETVIQGKVLDHDATEQWVKIDTQGDKPRVVRTNNVKAVIIYDLESDEIYTGSLSDVEIGAAITTKLRWSNTNTLVVYQ